MPRTRLLGLLAALLLLLLLGWWMRPPASVPSKATRISDLGATSGALQADAPSLRREPTVIPAQNGTRGVPFRLVRDTEQVTLSGVLHVDSVESGHTEYAVDDGAGILSAESAAHLLDHARAAVIPASVHGEAGAVAVLAVQGDESSENLDLQLAPTIELRLRVTNLAGEPLAGASVVPILDFALIEPRSEQVTNADGEAVVRLAVRGSRVQFRASMPGFAPHQQAVAVEAESQQLEIRLRRILGYVVAIDRRWRGRLQGSYGVSSIGTGLPRPAYEAIQKELNQRGLVDPVSEDVYLRLFSETEWIDSATGQVGLIVGGSVVAAMEVPVLPISDPAFSVHRFPAETVSDLVSYPEVVFELLPVSSFLSTPPAEFRVRLKTWSGDPDEPGDTPHSYTLLRHVGGTRYRTALPAGEYEFEPAGLDWDMDTGSLGDAAAPGFSPGQRFRVPWEGQAEPIPIYLAPAERWIRYSIVDPFGRPLDARVLLFPHRETPHPAESQFVMIIQEWPVGRFIRPGGYDLLTRVRAEEKCLRVGPVFDWPPLHLPSDGHVRIAFPTRGEAFDPFLFQ